MRNYEQLLDDSFATEVLTLEIILCKSIKRTFSSIFLIVFERFHSLAPIREKAFFLYFKSSELCVEIVGGRGSCVVKAK